MKFKRRPIFETVVKRKFLKQDSYLQSVMKIQMPGRGLLSKRTEERIQFPYMEIWTKKLLKTKVQLHLLQMKLAKSRERNIILSNKSIPRGVKFEILISFYSRK